MHHRAKQAIQHKVAIAQVFPRLGGYDPRQHEFTPQSGPRRSSGRKSRVIGLPPSHGYHNIRTLSDRVPQEELKLAQLVTAATESGDVVTFHENPHATEFRVEPC
jgi:hypothetical protein